MSSTKYFKKAIFYAILPAMEIKQRLELKKLLIPALRQSLNILTLPLLELKSWIEQEMENNPLLEEAPPKEAPLKISRDLPPLSAKQSDTDLDYRLNLITKEDSLQDILLRQLGMFTNTDEELKIGQEIIGNIDENGYLKVSLPEIATTLNLGIDKVENVLKLIQQFDPAGVAARTVAECLLIQLEAANEKDPLFKKIIENHLEDIAKKNYSLIAKNLNEPQEKIEQAVKKILKLDPKPGRIYTPDEPQRVIPDIFISEKGKELALSINDEDIPMLKINQDYRGMLKNDDLDPETREFLTNKLNTAVELLRAISKRKFTLRKIVETIIEIQHEAIKNGLSHLKPLTFQEVAQRLDMHESTVCRAVMNKYADLPCGIVALKDFFSSHVHDQNGQSISSSHVKKLIKDLIDREDKKHPLSDQDIFNILTRQNNLAVSRRTIAKYREELKILSTSFRKEH